MLNFKKLHISLLSFTTLLEVGLISGLSASGINPAPGLPISGEITPFFPDGTYDPKIPKPEDVLGFVMGARPARYEEMVKYISILADKSPEVILKEYGQTYEGRKLYYLIISSQENISKLDQIKEGISLLADPRKLKGDIEAKKLKDNLPWPGWLTAFTETSCPAQTRPCNWPINWLPELTA